MEIANGKVTLHAGDCLEVLAALAENSIDAVVTDPPYHFTSIVKRFGKENAAPAQYGTDGAFARSSRGFMGKEWDGGDIAFRPETWALVCRVLKPGGHLVSFGAPKNYHRLACAIEDAGFEIRDSLMWVFGTGFPKSHNLEGGFGTALKPAYEPIVLARKPLSEKTVAANVLRWGTGALNIDACRIGISDGDDIYAKNPHTVGTIGANGIYGTGRATEYNVPTGRWPANLCHDGSQGVLDLFPQTGKSTGRDSRGRAHQAFTDDARKSIRDDVHYGFGDEGSAARFFYSAKANKQDRAGSKHPTVKPVALMQWLVRMVTPPGGTVLDPFAGTGTTGRAAVNEGFQAVLIEREEEYRADIVRRFDV